METKNQIENFCSLCKDIYQTLTLIERYDKETFNKLSKTSIEDYMQIFNNLYENFYSEVFKLNYQDKLAYYILFSQKGKEINYANNDNNLWLLYDRFHYDIAVLKEERFIIENKDYMVYDNVYTSPFVVGIKDEYYDTIKSAVNKILILERELKFLTMKPEFWKGIANCADDINLDGDYIICGKLLFEDGWRDKAKEEHIINFGNKKIYQSASVINQNQLHKLFTPSMGSTCGLTQALLVYKFDFSKICCVCSTDAYSDELINGSAPFTEYTVHSNIQKIDEDIINNDKHELFATCPVFSTLNTLLNFRSFYNEVVFKNPEIIAVIAMNSKSTEYAQQLAKQHNVKYLGVAKKKTHYSLENMDLNDNE